MIKDHRVRDAFLEWVAGIILGALPLGGHAVVAAVLPESADKASWAIDILFVAISASGTSVLSAVMRLIKRVLPQEAFGVGIGLMLVFNVVLVVLEAAMYGAVASGLSRPNTVGYALGFLAASALCSVLVELVIANRTPLSVIAVE